MVRQECKTISKSLLAFKGSLGFRPGNVRRPILQRASIHFGLLTVGALSCLLAICNAGCKTRETSPSPSYPWINDEPNSLPQTTLWKTYVDAGRKAHSNARYAEAEQLFKAALEEAEKYGSENYRLGQTLYWLGSVVLESGRPKQAKPLLERALVIIERLSTDETAQPSTQIVIADILSRLSEIEAGNNNYSLAKALANKSANMSRKVGNNQLLVVTLKNLANINIKSNDYDSAIEMLSELIQLEPNNATYYYNRALLHKHTGDFGAAVADMTKLSKLQPDNARILNDLAWTLSTHEADEFRNGHRAVELAQKSVVLSKRKNPQYLDTLAAAYAETSQFDMAVRTQQEAISLLTDQVEIEEYLTKLRLYVDHKPYRESNKK